MNRKANKRIGVGLIVGVILVSISIGCRAKPSIETTPSIPVVNDLWVDITGVAVIEGEAIEFWGQTNLSKGDCLYSQLFADESPVEWWPVGKCFPVSDPDWNFRVSLGVDGAPENLSEENQYQIRIWWAGAPESTADKIYFDLAAPPAN